MDIQGLTSALDERMDDLSAQAWDIFRYLVPETRQWNESQQKAFVGQARSRLTAVLAVTSHGAEVGDALREDLHDVGANASTSKIPLQQLLLTIRISRDVLLQAAMQITAQEQAPPMVLLSFSQKMLPSVDRLTDALSTGYWTAKLDHVHESMHRFASLVQRIPYGIYEVDIDGLIRFANPALAQLIGRSGENLEGHPINAVLKPVDGSVDVLLNEPADDISQTTLNVIGPDGAALSLDVDMVVRRVDGVAVGFAGLVRQSGPVGVASIDLTPLIRHIHELRRSIEILEDAGNFVHNNSAAMTVDQVSEAGDSIARQAQRLMAIVEELDADRHAIQPVLPL